MIKLNHLSERIHGVMIKRFNVSRNASVKAWLLYMSSLWREADKSLHEPECQQYIYSHLELVIADIILLCIALLHRLGVRNIENLLRRRLEDNETDNKLKK